MKPVEVRVVQEDIDHWRCCILWGTRILAEVVGEMTELRAIHTAFEIATMRLEYMRRNGVQS